MVKNSFPLFALLTAILLSGCEEKTITIPKLSVGKRNVLVEELTGVHCPNCPNGSAKLSDLGQQFGSNLIVVSIHAAIGYNEPFTESKYDFRTAKGTEMASFIGSAEGFPSAAVDRRLLPSETDWYLAPQTKWSSPIIDDLAKDPVVGVFMDNQYDPVNRRLDITVNIAPETTITDEARLTVLITQDSIQDYQQVNLVKVPDYYHRHVLRDVLTQSSGDVISEPLNAGAVVTKTFSYTLPADWDENHCAVVAFVHHGTTPDKEVLQAAEEHVIQ